MSEDLDTADTMGYSTAHESGVSLLSTASHCQPETERLPTQSKRAVLILEDDSSQLQLLQQHVESLGLQTVCARSLAEARSLLHERSIALSVLDLQLPDGSGIELCSEIDDNPKLMGMPVIVLSACTQPNIVRQIRAAGACFFISKPYDPNVLLTIIESAIGQA